MNSTLTLLGSWLMLLVLWQPSIAAEKEAVQYDCTIAHPYSGKLFADLYKTTESTAKTLCTALIRSKLDPDPRTAPSLIDFATESEQTLNRLKLEESADYHQQFKALRKTFEGFNAKNITLPEFKIAGTVEGNKGYFEPLEGAPDRFVIKEVGQCKTTSPSTCKEIFREFQSAFNPYRAAYDNVYDNTKLLLDLADRWDKFLDVSKSQTVLEVELTTWVNQGHFKKDHLVGPPPYQVIALHPQLIYDSMRKSSIGSKEEAGLAVEWAGVNFWDLKLPLGISLASAYVSRDNANDFGHGVMLHIMNHYAVGWARHGGDDSFYVTIDLLKAIQSKKSQFDKYVKSYL